MSDIESCALKYGEELSRLCWSLTRNRHDAEDLYQDTWLRAINSADALSNASDKRKWLFTVCCNRFRDLCRQKKLRGEAIFDSAEHKERFFASLPDYSADEKSDYEALYGAIDALPSKLRIALSLKYFSRLSDSDVAEVLGISYAAARARISRAVKKLTQIMNGGKK